MNANEFAGRVSTKVMQTALAVRGVMKIIDVFVYAISFVVSMFFVVLAADVRLAIPLVLWLATSAFCFILCRSFAVFPASRPMRAR